MVWLITLFHFAHFGTSSQAQTAEVVNCDKTTDFTKIELNFRLLDELDRQARLPIPPSTQAAEAWKNFQNDPYIKKCGSILGPKAPEIILKELYIKDQDNKSSNEKTLVPQILANALSDGKAFMSAADLALNSQTESELLLLTLNRQSSTNAEILARRSLPQFEYGKNLVIPDHTCELIDKYISKPKDKIKTISTLSSHQIWMDKCGGLLYLEQIENIAKNIHPSEICDIKSSVSIPLEVAYLKIQFNGLLSQLEQQIIAKTQKLVTELKQYPSKEACPGYFGDLDRDIQNSLEKLLPFIQQQSTQSPLSQSQNTHLAKEGVCDPKSIHSWIINQVETSYKTEIIRKKRIKGEIVTEIKPGPSRLAMGGGQIDQCHFVSRIKPFTEVIVDKKTKRRITQNWAHVRIEILRPLPYLIDFKVLDSEIIFGIYDQFQRSGLLKAKPVKSGPPLTPPLPSTPRLTPAVHRN